MKTRSQGYRRRWTKKNNDKHFDYNNHAKVSRKIRMAGSYAVTAASFHDSQELVELLDSEKDSDVWADNAYQSTASTEALKELGILNHLHEPAYRNRLWPRNRRSTTRSGTG